MIVAKKGDRIKAIGSHSYKGREGVVTQCENIDGQVYVHASLDNGPTIIMRPGQFTVVKRAWVNSLAVEDRLSPEVLQHVRRVVNNWKISIPVRRKVLENVRKEIDNMLDGLSQEEQG
jgi:hypothetical protein